MSIQGVGRADSWAEFVRLVQEARSRSQGTGGGAYPVSGLKKGASLQSATPLRPAYGVMRNEQMGAATPAASKGTRIIGTFFDAYA
jgi:hypothetical protein